VIEQRRLIVMKADRQTEHDVMATLIKGHEAYAQRNIDGLLALFSPDADVVMLGTGVDEKRVGLAEIRAQAERDWAQVEASSVEFNTNSVSSAGSVAWVTSDATFHITAGGQQMDIPTRITAVLEKRNDKWLVAQAHYSLPWAEQAEGESFPA
jgi:uncharacterized protein (TIGR02246 family)